MSQDDGDAAGRAALSICESLLLTLLEKGVIETGEAMDALEDAAMAHRHGGQRDGAAANLAAAQLIETMMNNLGPLKARDARAGKPWSEPGGS